MSHLKKILLFLAILPIAGCGLSDVIAVACVAQGDNGDHCWQTVAVQDANTDECAKVTGHDFVGSGENPPRDKCYLLIAENTDNTDPCKDIKGGFTSYTQEQCVSEIASKDVDDSKCAQLEGPAQDQCKQSVQTAFKAKREEVLKDVDDPDVKAEIVKETLAIRDQNPGMSLKDQLAKLQEIKDQQETVKRLDDEANALVDNLKSAATDYATDKVTDAVTSQGKAFIQANGGEKLQQGIAELEGLKEKYDKASEQYAAISAQIDKLKGVYDQVTEVYGKIDDINKMVADGKVDPGKASVLKGAVYLGKGLEYATGYVPVFGSTVSTITKETMNATLKFATSRAKRTTALDKCIDDPEHCDPSGITPY